MKPDLLPFFASLRRKHVMKWRGRFPGFHHARAIIAAHLLFPLGYLYRRLHPSVTYIAVTGSSGKTTAKELAAAVLRSEFKGVVSRETKNRGREVVRSVFMTTRSSSFCLQELGAFEPASLDALLHLFRPNIGVVLNVAAEHRRGFGSVEEVAREKAKLVQVLPQDGTAILNHDDPRVREMARGCAASVLFFGVEQEAELRADNLRSQWPDPLSFEVVYGGEAERVQTQLHGEHWVYGCLAAVAVGIRLGVPLRNAAQAISTVKPFPGRMDPIKLASGATLLRDDWKAPSWSFPLTLKFFSDAVCNRKVLVLGRISDDPLRPRRLYRRMAQKALQVVDEVCFVGPGSTYSRASSYGIGQDSVRAFESVSDLARYLKTALKTGDLVLVKGTRGPERLECLVDLISSD